MLAFLISGAFEGARIAIAGIGFGLIFYTTRELHFAYGTGVAAAAYLCLWLVDTVGLAFPLAVVLAVAFGALLGAVIKGGLYRWLPNDLAVLLFSFGLTVVLQNVLLIVFGADQRSLDVDALNETTRIGDEIIIQGVDWASLGALAIVAAAVYYLIERRRLGLAIRAVMRDPEMAEYVGVRTFAVGVGVYAIGSAIGAVSGVIQVTRTGVDPSTGFDLMLSAFVATILGAGSIFRLAAWGVALGVAEGALAWKLPGTVTQLVVFSAMLGYIVLRADPTVARLGLRLRERRRRDLRPSNPPAGS